MRKLLFYFLVLLLAVWVGLKIAVDPGYLLIAYQKTTVEMPLWLAVVTTVVAFAVLYILARLISNVRSLGARLRAWSRQRRVRRAWQRTHRGLIALSANEWKLAEKDLIRAAPYTDTPLINYLAAAQAAQAQQALTRRDAYLGSVQTKGRLSQLALGLTQARLYLRQHEYEHALAILQQLHHFSPKHPPILRLLKNAYLHIADWAALETLLPSLEKCQVVSKIRLQELTQKVYQGLLKTALKQADNSPEFIWQRIPKPLRLHPALIEEYLPYLIKKDVDAAEQLLRQTLQKNFDTRLVEHYGMVRSTHPDKQLETAEEWLTEHPKHSALLLTLGRLCIANQLWGKARSYLDASLALQPQPMAYYENGKLAEQLGESAKAMEYYRKGLALGE